MTDILIPPGVAAGQAELRLGLFVLPSDEGWDEARQAWNLAVDQQPAAVALPRTAADVRAVVVYARDRGLRVAAQGTGHNAAPLGDLSDTILVKTHLMTGVEIDPQARIARVEAGVLWQQVVDAAAPHGLAALSGSSPDVGVVGYTLGGGLSWLARRYGLASDRVLAIELVTAEGVLVRVDRRSRPDLFWALRGGGGSFGVVTAIEFELLAIDQVYAGALFFPIERAAEVLHAWREWAVGLPDTVTSVGRTLRFPPTEDVPEPLRGRDFVIVESICLTDELTGADLVSPLRTLGAEMDTFATMPPAALIHLHMDPPSPVPGMGDSLLLGSLPAEAVDAAVAAAQDEALLTFEIRHLGGAVARRTPGSGALGAIDAPFGVFGGGLVGSPESAAAVTEALAGMRAALTPWSTGRQYLNFAEHKADPATFFGEQEYARLRRIKAQVDPADLFRSNHPIPPATS